MGGVYQPVAFVEDRLPVLHGLMARAALAHLVTVGRSGIEANPVPLLLDADRGPYGTLVGHLARANPQWQGVAPGAEALAIFAGADAYVSPSSYPSKAEGGRVVPTWDYVVVHAHGPLIVHDDPTWVEGLVRRLTDAHEAAALGAGGGPPWSVDDAPAPFVAGQLRAIVGIEVPIRRLEGKRKLSQNRPPGDIAGVLATFEAGTPRQRGVAEAMHKAFGAPPSAAPPT